MVFELMAIRELPFLAYFSPLLMGPKFCQKVDPGASNTSIGSGCRIKSDLIGCKKLYLYILLVLLSTHHSHLKFSHTLLSQNLTQYVPNLLAIIGRLHTVVTHSIDSH